MSDPTAMPLQGNAPTPAAPAGLPPVGPRRWLDALVRDPNPILVKELRATFRTALFIRFLYVVALVVGIVVLAGGAAAGAGEVPPATVGQIVFQIFFGTALLVLMLVAAPYASTSFTSEHEQRTFESLLLSGMSPRRLVWGKFLAAYGSFVLILVALAPAVGIAFLFGGISPWHVVSGYAALLLMLAPAVAFGVAVSARLRSTRIAIVVALFVFFPLSFSFVGTVWGIGEAVKSTWGFGMSGPFWFSDAIVVHPFSPETIGCLYLLPLFLSLAPTWYLLSTAVAAIAPAAEDRSTGLKLWAVASSVGFVLCAAGFPLLASSGRDAGHIAIATNIAFAPLLVFYALLLTNEPPLPPRRIEQLRDDMPLPKRILLWIGPGAAACLRFTVLQLTALATFVVAIPMLELQLLWGSDPATPNAELGLLALLVGNLPAALACASFGAWLRTALRNGVAARVLTIAALAAATLIPYLFAFIVDFRAMEHVDTHPSILLFFSPSWPSAVSVILADSRSHRDLVYGVAVTALTYGIVAIFFWLLVELRVARVRKDAAAWRAEREARAQATAAARAATSALDASSSAPASSPTEPGDV